MVITVNGSAANCRPRHAKLTLKYKNAMSVSEQQASSTDYTGNYHTYTIPEWGASDIEHEAKWLGLSGSPTKVKQIEKRRVYGQGKQTAHGHRRRSRRVNKGTDR